MRGFRDSSKEPANPVPRQGFLRRLRDDVSGNVFMLSAAALLPLLAMIGSALDMSILYMARARLQNACDSGVLAGRQLMQGTVFDEAVEAEADRFFNFNFPEGANGATNIEFAIEQNETEEAELLGEASATIPTVLMKIFGYDTTDISVTCDAMRDFGHNDIVLVLDVTGSMAQNASGGGGQKIARLRTGARGIYASLADVPNSTTRYGIVPYSHTVNVARSLADTDILNSQNYYRRFCSRLWGDGTCREVSWGEVPVTANNSTWGSRSSFRTSGNGCIEERSSRSQGASPVRITSVERRDIDDRATGDGTPGLQFGRYDPASHEWTNTYLNNGTRFYRIRDANVQVGCPSEATRLQEYADEAAFQTAVNNATARVTGGTYHDVGLLWGTRFMSRTGFFASDNPTERDSVPVNQHIVFMTDGMLDTGTTLYSAHGIETYQDRTRGGGTQDEQHIGRFEATCDLAKSMGITIWVIALDVGATDDIEPCASSPNHFFISDGSDLEEVFERIGQGIGRLRLTQ